MNSMNYGVLESKHINKEIYMSILKNWDYSVFLFIDILSTMMWPSYVLLDADLRAIHPRMANIPSIPKTKPRNNIIPSPASKAWALSTNKAKITARVVKMSVLNSIVVNCTKGGFFRMFKIFTVEFFLSNQNRLEMKWFGYFQNLI